MPKIVFVVPGPIPSKKNQRITFVHKYTGKIVNIPSKRYKDWHKVALKYLSLIPSAKVQPFFLSVDKVELRFWFKTKQTSDLSNKAESVMDLLVDAEILLDDSWKVVGRLELISMGKDKQNPRCEITLIKEDIADLL